MAPTTLLPVISLLLLVSVEYGGWSLLGFLTGRGQLGEFRKQFFRTGHAHAGVLLVLSLVYFLYLDRTGYSTGVQWLAGLLLLVGIMAQSGGFFLHLALGQDLWRAGHAHAGVWLVLSLVALRFVDEATLSEGMRWVVRLAFPVAAVLMALGFFLSVLSPGATEPNALIYLTYVAGLLLAVGLLVLGVGLIRGRRTASEPA